MNALISDHVRIETTVNKQVLTATSKGFAVERFSDSTWRKNLVYRGRLICRHPSFNEAVIICHITATKQFVSVGWVLETEVIPGFFESVPGFNMRREFSEVHRDFEIAQNFKKEGYYIEYARQLGVI